MASLQSVETGSRRKSRSGKKAGKGRLKKGQKGSSSVDSQREAFENPLNELAGEGTPARDISTFELDDSSESSNSAVEVELVEAFKEGDAETARALLKKGADPNFLDPESKGTLLQVAALHGHLDCLEAALEAGADIDRADPVFEMTPFLWACHNAHLTCVEHLVRAGCNADAVDSSGLCGQELAKENLKPGWENIVRFLTEKHGAKAIDVSKELAFSNAQKKRMRSALGSSADSDDALNMLFTTEQTSQGGKRKRCDNIAALDDKAEAEAARIAAKEMELRSAFTPEHTDELFDFVDARLADATKNEKQVTSMLRAVCKQCKGRMHGLEFNIKGRESTFSKALRKMGPMKGLSDEEKNVAFKKAINSLRDLLRYTMVLKTKTYVKGVNETIQRFHQNGVEPVPNTIKNFWRRKGQDTDYLGINSSFLTLDGFPFELQFHTDESIEVKMGQNRNSYQQFRLTKGIEKLQWWEDMVRLWSVVPIPEPIEELLNIGTKAYHGVDKKSLEATLSEEELQQRKRERSLEAEVRPACDRVYATSLTLAGRLTAGIKSSAKKDGGSLRGEEHICKNAMSMTRKVVADLLADGWKGNDNMVGIDRALVIAVDNEKRNALRYTIVFSEKKYVRGIRRVLAYLNQLGFKQTIMNNYWMGDEPYNAIRGRLHSENAGEIHDVAVVFHTNVSLQMSEERLVRLQEAMGLVIHTATLVSSEAGSEDRRQQAEELLRQDRHWVSRCANLSTKKPADVEAIGKVITSARGEMLEPETEPEPQPEQVLWKVTMGENMARESASSPQGPPARHVLPTKSGYLLKKGSFKVWQRRWFVLEDGSLLHFRSPEQKFQQAKQTGSWKRCFRKHTGESHVDEQTSSADVNMVRETTDEGLDDDFDNGIDFIVTLGTSKMLLRAASREERSEWIKTMDSSIAKKIAEKEEDAKRRMRSLTLDDLHIGELIGSGSVGTVKLAVHVHTGMRIAVKVIPKRKFFMNKKLQETTSQELAVMDRIASFAHPHIVSMYGYCNDPKHIYIAMELCEGGELLEELEHIGNYTEHDAATIMRNCVDTLGYLHARGIVHRDIKPENMLLKRSGDPDSIKLADFGLAGILEGQNSLKTVCGTPAYMPPEVLSEKDYDAKVDMWSMGVMLYLLLSGTLPFLPPRLVEKAEGQTYEFAGELWGGVSDAAKDLVTRLLIADPKVRYGVKEVLSHPWITGEQREDTDLNATKKALALFSAKRKFKGAAHAVIAGDRMRKAMASLAEAAAETEVEPDAETAADSSGSRQRE